MESFQEVLEHEYQAFKNTVFVLPQLLRQTYKISESEKKQFVDELKGSGITQVAPLYIRNDSYWTETVMKRCFKKCKQFVLEDWVDYDELDCTMKCTLLNKKAIDVLNETMKKV